MDNMAFGGYNKRFEPARTDKDWLTRDEKEVDAYLANPWCTFRFTVNAYYHMFCGIEYAQKKRILKKSQKICRCIWWQDQTILLETSEKVWKM